MDDLAAAVERQKVLADFGELALRCEDIDQVLGEACRLVGNALSTGYAKVLEIQPDGRSLLVRAGVGWKPGIVGFLHIPLKENSSERFAIEAGEPVITQNIGDEHRFDVPAFMKDAGVVALVNVPIFLPGGRPYGLLEVDDTKPREFGKNEIQFLRTYATVLGPVVDRLLMARTLRTTEERFRLTVEAALDYAIFLTDPQDRVTDWLPGAQAVFGWTAEEAVGQPSAIIFTPEDRETCQDQLEIDKASREGVAPNVRWHVRKDGDRVFIEGSTRALRNPDGDLLGFIRIGQDVTQRRGAEDQLRESEKRFRALVDATSYAVYRMSHDWAEMRQLDGHGFLVDTVSRGASWWDEYIVPEDRPQIRSAIEVAIKTKRAFDLEHRVRQLDGRIGWTHSRAVPLLDESGEIQEWFGAASDISARKSAEAALRESEERFRQFADASSDVIWIRDANTLQLEFLSSAFEVIYGQSRQAPLNGDTFQQWIDLIHPEDRERTLAGVERTRAGERTMSAFRIVRASDGETRWIENTDFPLQDEQGRVQRVAGLAKDVTEARRSAARLEVLVAELQHRTRNLLGVVAAVAAKTLGDGEHIKTYQARLSALGRVQGLLSQSGSDTVEVEALIRAELAAYDDGTGSKVKVSGPKVMLTSYQVQNLSLAVHELTTNAVKYGGLREGLGKLSVTWAVEKRERGHDLVLLWSESGVDVQPDKVMRRGYGRQLIEKALSYALRAKTDFVLGEDGVQCRVELPLA